MDCLRSGKYLSRRVSLTDYCGRMSTHSGSVDSATTPGSFQKRAPVQLTAVPEMNCGAAVPASLYSCQSSLASRVASISFHVRVGTYKVHPKPTQFSVPIGFRPTRANRYDHFLRPPFHHSIFHALLSPTIFYIRFYYEFHRVLLISLVR